ncbi:MAG: segregation/condensation protein A [Clostridia bacterium]|nr:segregation/condensation protein A [Clostridia bacterium]
MEDIFVSELNTVENAGPDAQGVGPDISAEEGELTAGEVLLKLDSFEGPFDLLLNLINRRNIDITEISISAVTDVYIDVVFKFGGFNADIASEYLVMAARLIYLKTKRLMPSEDTGEAGEMTEADIAERVRIYEKYKLAAETLTDFYLIWQDSLCRGREIIDFPKIEESVELDVNSLVAGYDRARMRYESLNRDNKEKMDVILKIEKVSIKEKISKIVMAVKERSKFKFSELFNVKTNSIPELVTGFLALLELGKLDAIKTEQNEVFGDIIIRRKHKDIDNIKINMEDYNEWSD